MQESGETAKWSGSVIHFNYPPTPTQVAAESRCAQRGAR
jgi:hypothetical protein